METWLKTFGSYLDLTKKFNVLDYYTKDHIRVVLSKRDETFEFFPYLNSPTNFLISKFENGEKVILTLIYKNGEYFLHSNEDEPSVIYNDGKIWHKYGLKHRDVDKPAYISYIREVSDITINVIPTNIISKKLKIYYNNNFVERDNYKPNIIIDIKCEDGRRIIDKRITSVNGKLEYGKTSCKIIENNRIHKLYLLDEDNYYN